MADPLNASGLFIVELTDSWIDLNRLTATTRTRVASLLRVLEAQLVRDLRAADLDDLPPSRRVRRLERLLRSTRETIATTYGKAATAHERGMIEIARFARDAAAGAIDNVFGVSISKVTTTVDELKALVRRDVVLGEPAKDWWAGQAEGTRRKFAREMRMGVLRGETNAELVKRIRGGATGRTIEIDVGRGPRRIREFKGGVMEISRNQADTLVRTSANSIGNAATLETYEANGDLIKGYEAVTTLDDRTTEICMARTGSAWYAESGDPFPESSTKEPFPGPPPWHFRCRTILSPVTWSWEELIEKASGKQAKALDTVPTSKRATMDGLIGSNRVRTFDDWLNIKGDAFAREKLGPGLFDLWKSGRITTSQLIDAGGNPLSLATLRARY